MPIPYLTVPKQRIAINAVILLMGFCGPITAFANVAEYKGSRPDVNVSQWGIGIGAISQQQGIEGIDRNTVVIPFLSYESQYIRWFGPSIDIKLPSLIIDSTQKIKFSLTGRYDFGGYDNDDIEDTPILQGMDEREGGFGIGAKAHWQNPWLDVNAQWMSDVSGDREGYFFSLGVDKTWMFGQQIMLSPRIVAVFLNDNYVDFQYGVRSYEATAARSMYKGEATVNIEYGMRVAYLFDKRSSVFIDGSITSLGDEIKDSPLVDSATENKFMLAYLYKF
ncbi:MipA/OmpV family protein [Paraglaciecola sp. 20A4]|uniref:MipA/OmpV family protein n=1 Tax=Paraglaciecola sp. 20A4 TaxID=2687288 RepID=UPI00140726EA|nr:MipA/OmpV family protein [Paraglaciecola sp. 20A4]